MSALEFYNQLEDKPWFTKLTSTGITHDLHEVFKFAEAYAKQNKPMPNELKDTHRDITTGEQTANMVKFITLVSPIANELNITYQKEEKLIFTHEQDAIRYMQAIISELQK